MSTILEQMGLTGKEAEVYQVILKLGETPIADVLKETHDHPQIIYRAIDGLIAQDLLSVVYKNHKKYVRAEDPAVFLDMEEKRLAEVKQLVPDLKALQKESKETTVKVYKGISGLQKQRFGIVNNLPVNSTFYIIGSSSTVYQTLMRSALKTIEPVRVKKNISRKSISFENQRQGFLKKDKFYNQLTTYRFLPDDFSIPSTTTVHGEIVAFFIFLAEPLAIEIKSPEIAKVYMDYFDALWKIAKP